MSEKDRKSANQSKMDLLRMQSPESRRHEMYVIHNARKRIKCVFITLIVRNTALGRKYPGGIQAFAEKHSPHCNSDISVTCHMGDDVDEVHSDLFDNGLKPMDDMFLFDAARYALNVMGPEGEPMEPHSIDLGVSWLRARYRDGCVYVWYVESDVQGKEP